MACHTPPRCDSLVPRPIIPRFYTVMYNELPRVSCIVITEYWFLILYSPNRASKNFVASKSSTRRWWGLPLGGKALGLFLLYCSLFCCACGFWWRCMMHSVVMNTICPPDIIHCSMNKANTARALAVAHDTFTGVSLHCHSCNHASWPHILRKGWSCYAFLHILP